MLVVDVGELKPAESGSYLNLLRIIEIISIEMM